MKRQKYNNIANQNSIEIMSKNTTRENIINVASPCGCIHTFSLVECKNNINNLQIGSQYFCEQYLA